MNIALNYRLGCQAWTFNRFTLFETIEKSASLGLSFVEAYPTQSLSPENPTCPFSHDSGESVLNDVKAMLAQSGVDLLNYGVVDLKNDEAVCRKVFDFAKTMGIRTIVSEPPQDALQLVDDLCNEYDIKLAIHNHPDPCIYWHPDTVLKACEGRSPYIGACADTGHWIRSGADPIESLKKLEGRIVSFHLKDVDRLAPDAGDVPWGTGVGNIEGVILEIQRQGIAPVISIEHELPDDTDPTSEVAECIAYIRSICGEPVAN